MRFLRFLWHRKGRQVLRDRSAASDSHQMAGTYVTDRVTVTGYINLGPPPPRKIKPSIPSWGQLTKADIDCARGMLASRRSQVLAQCAEELRMLDAQAAELERIERGMPSIRNVRVVISNG